MERSPFVLVYTHSIFLASEIQTTFFTFQVCPRKSSNLNKIVLDDGVLFNFIDIIFQVECSEIVRWDLNLRMTMLKTIQHLSPMISEEQIRVMIIKHLFQRLYDVKWNENLSELLVPANHNQPKMEKFEISFNIEKSILCNAETSQIVTHAQGGRGYCQVRRGISSNGHQGIIIKKDHFTLK